MLWIWILGILLGLLLILLMTRVGVQAGMRDGTLMVDAKVGWFHFRVLPVKKKREKKEKPEKEEKKQVASERSEKKKPKITFADVKDAVQTLWPPLKRALNRTRRGIRIRPMTLSLTLGAANDPASGAELYGYLHAGIWTVMPVLENLLVIPNPSIHVGLDFEASDTKVEGEIGLTARIGTLLCVALTIAIPALRWFLRWNKKMEQPPVPQSAAEKQTAA